jgi:uroporphyrinogen decarboxylase
MTSRERIRKTLNHEEPDRIPIDWGEVSIAGIHAIAYQNLLKYLNIEEEINIHDYVQVLALPSEYILKMLEVDTRYILPNNPSFWKIEYDENGGWINENGTKYKRVGDYCDFVDFPLANCETIEDLKKFKMAEPTDAARFAGLREKAIDLYENTEYAICGYPLPTIHYTCWGLRGYQNFMLDTAADPAFSNYLMDMVLEYHIAYMDCYLDKVGDYIDIMWCGDDWGTQTGPLIRPEDFRENVKPRFAKLIQSMKKKSKAKLAYHSCGSVYWCLGDLVDIGVDIIQPVQANATDMTDAKKLKQEFGDKLVFHGGVDNQGTFHTTPDIIQKSAKEKIDAFKPGGGYIFSSGHNVQSNCTPQNILALFDACKKNRNYNKV